MTSMLYRILFLALMLGTARASDAIAAPALGASASVSQPHVTAELIPETTAAQAGQPFEVALHLHMDEGWHTYWINPGDAGLATRITWTLPEGFTAGPIEWPTPEKHSMGPLVTYGYGGDVYLLTTITPPKENLPQHFEIKAKASWLVCQEECIPGKAELTLPMDSGLMNLRLPQSNADLFTEAKARIPVENNLWDVSGDYRSVGETSDSSALPKSGRAIFEMGFESKAAKSPVDLTHLYFFPEQTNVLSPRDPTFRDSKSGPSPQGFLLAIDLIQNGDTPDKLSGVLVADQNLIGSSKAVYISNVTIFDGKKAQGAAGAAAASASQRADGGQLPVASGHPDNKLSGPPEGGGGSAAANLPSQAGGSGLAPVASGHPDNKLSGPPEGGGGSAAANLSSQAGGSGSALVASGHPDNELSGPPGGGGASGAPAQGPAPATTAIADDGHRPPLQTAATDTTLLAVLGAAFIGGLILNLMPCVLPVLSLKVFSLMKHAGENAKAAWIQGVAFTAGVVISFWLLAGLLIVLRTAGNHLGWGFQMQSPGFVLGLILLFFVLGLNLFGVFELGASLVGLDAKAAGKLHGTVSSFGNGALATLAATPCTAPFMGSALGFAAQQPAYISLLIFTFLALGMATPYLLLTIFPGALRFVPKPGAWMEAFKQFMGFLLMATVIFLVYVFGALVGEDQVPGLLAVLLFASVAAWIYGKWATPIHSAAVRFVACALAVCIFAYAIFWGVGLANTVAVSPNVADDGHRPPLQGAWQPWTQTAVDAALAKGQPVFVDFTAAWCLSCKVNERVALGTDAVKKAFTDKKVALFVADWTHSDREISQTLQKFNRDGVPLYLLYSPQSPTAPQVLPEVLTPGIVLDALGKL